MYIAANGNTYDTLISVSFSPSTDIVGNKLPINVFSADIRTQDDIPVAIVAELRDNNDDLWAKYWITDSERLDEYTLRIKAQSTLLLLDRFTMPAKYYSGVTASVAIAEVFDTIQSVFPSDTLYTIEAALQNKTITGFCKEQTARERLQWICFCICAYVKTYFNAYAEIKEVSNTQITIPEDETFYKPSVSYGAYVTKVRVRAYTYTQGTPQTVDKWVTDGTNYYIETTQDYTLINPDIPATVTENEVAIDKVTIINSTNAADILSNLAKYYFKRIQLQGDVLNDGEYTPGGKYLISTGDRLISGYMTQAVFSFGHGSRSKVTLLQADEVASAKLTIRYMYLTQVLQIARYLFPDGYVYTIANPYIDKVTGNNRRVYIPDNAAATGTMSAGLVDDESYDIALDWSDYELYIISVDSVSESGGTVSIG